MALITWMPQSRRGSKSPAVEDDQLPSEDDDSGCECSLEELEGMDAWTKTLVAIRVLTAAMKRRKKKLEEERQEKVKKERSKNLWRRLVFKLRIFDIFAGKISADNPVEERIVKLKRKLGKTFQKKVLGGNTFLPFKSNLIIYFSCIELLH